MNPADSVIDNILPLNITFHLLPYISFTSQRPPRSRTQKARDPTEFHCWFTNLVRRWLKLTQR